MNQLVVKPGGRSLISEAYRSLRTNIQFANPIYFSKEILFTSVGPNEGKSTTVANLSATLALMGNQVVMVDCDLRKPVLHKIFGCSQSSGITNILADSHSIDENFLKTCIQETRIPNLHLLASGSIPPNPSELLGIKRFDQIMEILRNLYDYVIVDTTPVIGITDSCVLASRIHRVMLIIDLKSTSKDMVLRSKKLLENVGAKINGVVVTKLKRNNFNSGYYNYYKYYYHEKGNGKPKTPNRLENKHAM
ncbi:MAG: hypothetical protein A2161_08190 [Candidatus Schekmanbacteria bacterium RBG_13_48_7]|uniref:non-specific protein-tyrosine kinase n=1 Tax=Candidatus Schekmanbacteria bacterium RBG_13_48_7 TaxID=1817878 RepID=A0A1F7RIE5_9BACT|nr:MAG: hypothetical protein A2161_08190 [Candidatus Schekmanbacteria bacterium RBG_13_48_7]